MIGSYTEDRTDPFPGEVGGSRADLPITCGQSWAYATVRPGSP